MIISASAIGRCAIILHLATHGALVHAASFRGAAADIDAANSGGGGGDEHQSPQPQNHHNVDVDRNLQQDPCDGQRNSPCTNDPNCNWAQGNCVPAPSTPPDTAPPTSPPSPSPTDSPTIPGMGYCSDDGSTPCWLTSECSCSAITRRVLQASGCSSATRRGDCNKLTGCDWANDVCESIAPPPTDSPVASTPQVRCSYSIW